MGKKLIGIAVMVIMLFGVFELSGCSNGEHKVYEDGYFQYIIIGENSIHIGDDSQVIAIVGFTELGKEQEVIDVPRFLGGKPVIMIGTRNKSFYRNNSDNTYSERLKKIYVHDNIQQIVCFEGQEVDLMLCSINIDSIRDAHDFFKSIYVYKIENESANQTSNMLSANIVFLNNYSVEVNGGYYRLDNIESGEKIPLPPIPNRVGYDFVGWYMEPECINAWDFDNEPTISANTEFRLYANWRAI